MDRDEFTSKYSAMIAGLQTSHPGPANRILTEDEVRDAVEDYLSASGWRIISRAPGRQQGIDLAAIRSGTRLEVEAKGAGAGPGSKNYGQAFTSTQVFVHVGEAVLKAMQSLSTGKTLAAIALPENYDHLRQVGRARIALERLGIIMFWVADDRTVRLEGNLAMPA